MHVSPTYCLNKDAHTLDVESSCMCVYVTLFCLPAHRNLALPFTSQSTAHCCETRARQHTHLLSDAVSLLSHLSDPSLACFGPELAWLISKQQDTVAEPSGHLAPNRVSDIRNRPVKFGGGID